MGYYAHDYAKDDKLQNVVANSKKVGVLEYQMAPKAQAQPLGDDRDCFAQRFVEADWVTRFQGGGFQLIADLGSHRSFHVQTSARLRRRLNEACFD